MMSKKDSRGLMIVSIVAIILMIGLLYKSYQVVWGSPDPEIPPVDSSLLISYNETIKTGPSMVEIDGKTQDEVKEDKEPDVVEDRKEEKKPEEKPAAVETSPTEKYIVITGSFGSKKNAENWKKELESKSYTPQIYFQKSRGLYYVYVKSFPKMDLAENYAAALRNKGVECHIKKI